MSEPDPRFYNPDGEEITLTDEVEFEEMMRKLKPPTHQLQEEK